MYHLQSLFVPNVPPLIPKVTLNPEQMVVKVAVAESAEVEFRFTVIVLLMQFVVLQYPSALKK